MKPFQVAEDTINEFKMYITTTFPTPPDLKNKVEEKIETEKLLWNGPYISLEKNYIPGSLIEEVFEAGLISKEVGGMFKKYGISRLYSHQDKAIQRILNFKNTIVATGTGSGKTEAFLIPIIEYCYQNRDKKGTKAVIIYPMNALANDQYERLKKLLKDTGITFGIYTSRTQDTIDKKPPDALEEERYTREEIQKDPPDILITNYSMLEYLLVRKEDQKIFKEKRLKFLVLDEIHTYRGAKGSEVACLIRRLKEHTGKLGEDRLVCIGTSATIKSQYDEDNSKIRRFAEDLFGEPFDADCVVKEDYVPPKEPENPYIPQSPRLKAEDLEVDITNTKQMVNLIEKLTLKKIKPTPTFEEGAYLALSDNLIAYLIEKWLLEEAHTISKLAEKLKDEINERASNSREELEREIKAYLIAGLFAKKDGKPRYRPRIHFFVRGLQGLVRCSNPECGEIFNDGKTKCTKCSSLTFPLEVCRNCGQDFLKTRFTNNDFRLTMVQPNENFDSDEKTLHITHRIEHVYEDPDEKIQSELDELYLCPKCGMLTQNPKIVFESDCEHEFVPVYVKQGKIVVCPACFGRYGNREVVTPVRSTTASDISIITTGLLSNLEFEERKTLIFTDNRQDTAHQAGYMEDRHLQFTVRQLIYKATEDRDIPISMKKAGEEIYKLAMKLGIIDPPKTKYEERDNIDKFGFLVFDEFTKPPRLRMTLEALKLLTINYGRIQELAETNLFKSICDEFGVEKETLLKFIKLFLDEMRFRKAVAFDYFATPDRKKLEEWGIVLPSHWKPTAYAFAKHDGWAFTINSFISRGGGKTVFEQMVEKLLNIRGVMIENFIKKVVNLLEREGYLVEKQIGNSRNYGLGYMVNPDVMEIVPLDNMTPYTEIWECQSCTKVHSANINGSCTTYHCKGTLAEAFPENDNFYVHHYTTHEPIYIRVAEHSGQIPLSERERYEKDFLFGKRNVIVCTPTLELGVDIGDLVSVLMRNMPPLPSNYAQRAGRAGRRTGMAVIFTYAREAPHDSYFYENPEEMITGEIYPPIFKLDNERVIRRHIRSLILEKINSQLPKMLIELVEKQNNEYRVKRLTDIEGEILERKNELIESIYEVFKEDVKRGSIPWLNKDYIGNVIDNFYAELEDTLNPLIEALNYLEKNIQLLWKKRDSTGLTKSETRELNELIDKQTKMLNDEYLAYTLSFLRDHGFLPGYAFPGKQSELILRPDRAEPLLRDTTLAVREFAPGNFVYVDRKKYQVYAVSLAKKGSVLDFVNSEENTYKICSNQDCDFITTDVYANYCEKCGSELIKRNYIEPIVYFARRRERVSSTEEFRMSIPYVIKEFLESEKGKGYDYEIDGLTIRFRRNSRIVVLNQGKGGSQFEICLKCGLWKRDDVDWDKYHKNCDGTEEDIINVDIVARKTADTLVLTPKIPNDADPEVFLKTLLHTMILGIQITLETELNEIRGFIRSIVENGEVKREIVLYENIPGGVGYLESTLQRFNEILEKAYDVLYSHDCDNACYNCLKNYYNQSDHQYLDKRVIRGYLENLLSKEITETKEVKGEEISLEDYVIRNVESPLEEEFIRLTREHGIPDPEPQVVIKDKEGNYIARADFAYKDRKIAIFIDGIKYHTGEVISHDREITNKLQLMRWLVLRFDSSQIKNDPLSVIKQVKEALEL